MTIEGHMICQVHQDGFSLFFREAGDLMRNRRQNPLLVQPFSYFIRRVRLFLCAYQCFGFIVLLWEVKQSAIATPQVSTVVLCDDHHHALERTNGRRVTSFCFAHPFEEPPDRLLHNIFYQILFLTTPEGDTVRIDEIAGKSPQRRIEFVPASFIIQIHILI